MARAFITLIAAAGICAAVPVSAQEAQDTSRAKSGSTSGSAADTESADTVSQDDFSQKAKAAGVSAQDLSVQILLGRAGFSPGVIDGFGGGNTKAAVRDWQKANGMTVDGTTDQALLNALRSADQAPLLQEIQVSTEDASQSFSSIPDGMEAQAELDHLGYESAEEMFAERYHMDIDLLKKLNPDADFSKAGETITVVRKSTAPLTGEIALLEISRSENRLRVYDADGKLITAFPATVGSSDMPSPDGKMEVRAVAPEAKYYFDPEANPNWGPDQNLTLAAGPNNPVGGVWIDLTKDTYGIHGTPNPSTIGKTASHGCVRLTNWDARKLADAVSAGTQVSFVN
ncbi:murein L,D-transpeptidase [Pacificimonas sp. WHA3]|uniref:Murein L,D-transpeptidase n=1 Tax=Pacificimonas pallii TaxID=2827236 RepID=A0ABS6SF82_9SPHN|nr:L,D-transpeptidase [Pacificimonas pallii]MBV7256758.1 murein L,D-transpeptidase [Pacificimonas pallii]